MKKFLCFLALSLSTLTLNAESSYVNTWSDITGRIVVPTAGPLIAQGRGDYQGMKQWAFGMVTSLGLYSVISPLTQSGSYKLDFTGSETVMAFSGSGFILRRYGLKWGLPTLAGSAFVAYGRANAVEGHIPGDIFVGMGVGLITSFIIATPFEVTISRSLKHEGPKVNVEVPF